MSLSREISTPTIAQLIFFNVAISDNALVIFQINDQLNRIVEYLQLNGHLISFSVWLRLAR